MGAGASVVAYLKLGYATSESAEETMCKAATETSEPSANISKERHIRGSMTVDQKRMLDSLDLPRTFFKGRPPM